MIERSHLPEVRGGIASAEAGLVLLDGPNGVAVAMTPDAADATARSLSRAAQQAREQGESRGEEDEKDGQQKGRDAQD